MPVLEDHFLVFVHHTIGCATRSGIQRVVIEMCLALTSTASVDFVKWDLASGQLRYADINDLTNLIGDEANVYELINPNCHRVNYRFGDTIENTDRTWIIFPEIPYQMDGGNEVFARIISQCKEYRVRCAAIFYDLIPCRDSDYSGAKALHIEYVNELIRCDRILAISKFAGDDLFSFYKHEACCSSNTLSALESTIVALPLGEYRESDHWDKESLKEIKRDGTRSIVLLGTVEPRKQQTRFLKVFNDLRATEKLLNEYTIEIFGSLHPASAAALHLEIARNPNIRYHAYSSDQVVNLAFQRAEFSVFISRNEGYGLPIVESLRRGVPCLTAAFGAMGEVGEGGGCLMTDVLDDTAIGESLLLMVRDSELLGRLRGGIAKRGARSWEKYAVELSQITTGTRRVAESELKEVIDQLRLTIAKLQKATLVTFNLNDVTWIVANVGRDRVISESAECGQKSHLSASLVIVDVPPEILVDADIALLYKICEADVLCYSQHAYIAQTTAIMRARKVDRLLPKHFYVYSDDGFANSQVAQSIIDVSREKVEPRERALNEKSYSEMAACFKQELQTEKFVLAIIISTYNRAKFTELNLRWLISLTLGLESSVCIVVVDNASTDDTAERLEKYKSVPNVTIKTNSANVGMLGNLRVTSALSLARHVWTIGDDDFIKRGAIERVLAALKDQPRIPLISHNFAVYHRVQLSDDDSPERFEAESTSLSRHPIPSGIRPIREMATEHDNLFTAIYPLVFRSDLVSACFNFPFDGVPFSNLVESVPTTKIVLESLSECDAYWLAEIGITGNAHNSWAGHRPRWHLVLMPEVFYLARRAKMDPALMWDWLNLHLDLFKDAVQIAHDAGTVLQLSAADIQRAEWIFQRKIPISSEVSICNTLATPFVTLERLQTQLFQD